MEFLTQLWLPIVVSGFAVFFLSALVWTVMPHHKKDWQGLPNEDAVLWFASEVLPRAIKKYGGIDADALRKAALEVDLPEGGTMLGFGVKFLGDGAMAGQNDRAFPIIVQYVDDKAHVVWPKSLQHRDPVLPLPSSSPYASQ